MKEKRALAQLFLSMLKIGLFTFGGGYAMIHLLDDEFVDRRRWIGADEFSDLVVIAESTPGPIAINCATYIGYKTAGLIGAVVATLGMCIPSFTVIYLISLLFDSFLSIGFVAAAFKGIQICVVYLIFSAGIKMLRRMKKKPLNIVLMCLTLSCMLILSLFAISFSTIFYILISGSVGILIYATRYFKGRREENK